MLISAILGINLRSTMDMDTTIKGFKLNKDNILAIFNDIIKIKINDGIIFNIKKVEEIREKDNYDGYRLFLDAIFDEMPISIKIDITTGDKITYREIKYDFNLMLEERKIKIWAYNTETVIAEKFECIIKRGIFNTRIRDFYDIYMLLKTQSKNIDKEILKIAIINTAVHRDSIIYIKNWKETYKTLKTDNNMKNLWNKYRKDNFYANEIEYDDVILTIEQIGKII